MLLPGVLLVASGAAFGGLAVLPAAAEVAPPRVTAAAATVPLELAAPAPANVELLAALSQGLVVANTLRPAAAPKPAAPKPAAPKPAATAAAKPAARPAPAKASRDRSPAAVTGAEFVRPGIGRLTSGYGRRWGRLHAGIDLASGIGSPVRAVTAGVVQSAGTEGGYGRAVRIRHSDGTITVYGHMSALLVSAGERVSAGEQIGREGNTGRSTGPHLHFEVRINGSPINPIPWLRQRGISV